MVMSTSTGFWHFHKIKFPDFYQWLLTLLLNLPQDIHTPLYIVNKVHKVEKKINKILKCFNNYQITIHATFINAKNIK